MVSDGFWKRVKALVGVEGPACPIELDVEGKKVPFWGINVPGKGTKILPVPMTEKDEGDFLDELADHIQRHNDRNGH